MLEKSAEMSPNLQKISFFEKVKHQSITLRRTGSDAGKQIKKYMLITVTQRKQM